MATVDELERDDEELADYDVGFQDRITEASVRDFVRHHLYEFSFRRADEAWLKSLLSTQRAERRRRTEGEEMKYAA